MYDIIKDIWTFIQTEVLGMQWLNRLIGSGLELLTLLIYMIGFIQSYFPPDRTKKIIGRYKGIVVVGYADNAI